MPASTTGSTPLGTPLTVRVNYRTGKEKDIPYYTNPPSAQVTKNPDVGVLFIHGAGGTLFSNPLNAIAQHLRHLGYNTLQYTCKGPMEHRVEVAKALVELSSKGKVPTFGAAVRRWILVGHSMGARVCVRLASSTPHRTLVGCLFVSYPMHPDNKPNELRVDEPIAQIPSSTPVLFLRGERDSFCNDAAWRWLMGQLHTVHASHMIVPNADHGLNVHGDRRQGNALQQQQEAMAPVYDVIVEFIQQTATFDTEEQEVSTVECENRGAEGEENTKGKEAAHGSRKGGTKRARKL